MSAAVEDRWGAVSGYRAPSLAVIPTPPSIATVTDRAPRVGDKLLVKTSEAIAYPLQQAGHDVAPYQGHDFEVGDIVEVLHVGPSLVNAAWIVYAGHENGESWWLAEGEFDILA